MNEDKSKLQLIGEIAEANNKNLELIEEINKLYEVLDKIKKYILLNCEIILHEKDNSTEVGKVDGKKILELLEEIE